MLKDQYSDRLAHVDRQQIIDLFFDDPQIRSVTFFGQWYKLEFVDGSSLVVRDRELEVSQ